MHSVETVENRLLVQCKWLDAILNNPRLFSDNELDLKESYQVLEESPALTPYCEVLLELLVQKLMILEFRRKGQAGKLKNAKNSPAKTVTKLDPVTQFITAVRSLPLRDAVKNIRNLSGLEPDHHQNALQLLFKKSTRLPEQLACLEKAREIDHNLHLQLFESFRQQASNDPEAASFLRLLAS